MYFSGICINVKYSNEDKMSYRYDMKQIALEGAFYKLSLNAKNTNFDFCLVPPALP